MEKPQVNITLGTAGHIDHGKTALVRCLTGCDTDFLKEEKQRGMSIDLGFAPCTIEELEVGIVDVPGHENFVKTMVAGASGIDGVIFVIAADDGVMPQTREHFDILTLLGVKHGIVALTKIDLVDQEHLDIVTEDIQEFLRGTFLEDAPILPVSSTTGQGFGEFLNSLKDLVAGIEPKKADSLFRLPVERAFSLKGYGTVVTGIPVAGTARTGDELTLFPHEAKGRVKAIQVYKRAGDVAMVGQCAALNVPQWDYKNISRGDVVTVGGYFQPQKWFLCDLRVLPINRVHIKHASTMKFHTGTSDITSTVYLLEGSAATAGQKCLAQIRLNDPVVAAPGDRFILRTPSPVQTVGGGMIVEAIPSRLRRSKAEVRAEAKARAAAATEPLTFAEYCIKTAEGYAATVDAVSHRTKMPPEKLEPLLEELLQTRVVHKLSEKLYIHRDVLAERISKLLDIVADYHEKHAESPGIAPEALLEVSKLSKDVFDGLLERMLGEGTLIKKKELLALPTHREQFSDRERQLIETVETIFRKQLFNPPREQEAAAATGAEAREIDRIIRILCEQQKLVRVEGMFFHAEAITEARRRLVEYITKEGRLESVKFKYLLDTTRKFAIPLLDYFDRINVLRRVGNTRYLNKPPGS